MQIKGKEFIRGFEKLVDEKNQDFKMDFGMLTLEADDSYQFDEAKECVFTLLAGEVIFHFEGKKERARRDSCFHENPAVLHVPSNTRVVITCLEGKAEVLVQAAKNNKRFSARLLRTEDLLCPAEMRGAGSMNEASTRIVRTFFDRSTCPQTNFFIGEVVAYPGKWSSYPPHFHKEPEVYFYRFLPDNGYGFAEIGDEVLKVRNNDLNGMPENQTHSQAAAPGYAEYYLWVIRLQDDADLVTHLAAEHKWTAAEDAKYFPNI